ncbi:snRNA-activating protein complex subunit 2 [Mantella aurantiaca]
MKPPVRRRSAPLRFEGVNSDPPRAAPIRLAWMYRDKINLLRGLKAQVDEKVPNPDVQGRSQAEVSSYIGWLRGRAARESVQSIYEEWVKERRAARAQRPAHIELWTDLVSRMSSPSEEAVTAAFSQMLTIASTEPVTLQHSIPSKAPRKRATRSSSLARKSSQQNGTSGEGPSTSGEGLSLSGEEPSLSGEGPVSSGKKPAADDRWKALDFEKIYKYLSKAATEEPLPQLSECESAVVLHLLHCIPDQLQTLDAEPLAALLRKSYEYMNASPNGKGPQEEEGPSSHPQAANWKELGFCPLNPFLLPLELLKPKEKTGEPS